MKILHLLASPWWSGPTEVVAALALAQRELGHEVTVAVDRKRAGGGAEEPAVPRLRALNLLDDRGLELSVKSNPNRVLRDLRLLKQQDVDVMHAHFSHDHLLARLSLPKGTRLIRSLHAPRSVRWSLPRADGFTVAFDAMAKPLERRSTPCLTLPAPVDPRFAPPPPQHTRAILRSRLGLSGAPLIGMASTFQPSRRHRLALDAFAKLSADHHPHAHLVLLGDGGLEPELRARAALPDLETRVTFAGYVSGDAFVTFLQALDELWVLGLGNDWSARVAAQGRACGTRIVAIDEGALSTYADATVRSSTPSPEAVVEASLDGRRRTVHVSRPHDVAERVLALYRDAGARS